jgi:hypothetical protein
MRRTFRPLLLSFATLWATTAFAEPPARLDIPFSFTIQSKSFPAGHYRVELDSNQDYITLANESETAKRIIVIAHAADRANHRAILKFEVMGDSRALRSVQIEGRISHNLRIPDHMQRTSTVSMVMSQ